MVHQARSLSLSLSLSNTHTNTHTPFLFLITISWLRVNPHTPFPLPGVKIYLNAKPVAVHMDLKVTASRCWKWEGRTMHKDRQIINQGRGWKMLPRYVALLIDFLFCQQSYINELQKKMRPAARLIRDRPHTAPLCHVVDAFIQSVFLCHDCIFFPYERNGNIIGQCWVELPYPLSWYLKSVS